MTATTEIGLPINCDTVFVKPHVLLERWVAKANWPDAGMYWTEDFERQVRVLRDELPCLIRQSAGLDDVPAWVISTHTSKSIELPVVWYDVPGRAIVLRDNFCDIAVSVASNKPLKIIPTGIFDPTEHDHDLRKRAQSAKLTFG